MSELTDTPATRELRDQLHAIEISVGGLANKIDAVTDRLKDISTDVRFLKGELLGDGTKPGILVRLDRLEQEKKLRDRILWTLGGVLVPLIFNTLWQLLR